MILTLTLNPTIDHIFIVEDFRLGELIRTDNETRTPSGKGIGSSLVIHELGGETIALGLNAGHAGRMLSAMLADQGIEHHLLTAQGETRIATVLVDRLTGKQSTMSAPTLHASERELSQLIATLRVYASKAWGMIFAGSLPPGLPVDTYATLLKSAHQDGLFTLLDTSGATLQRGIEALPSILKINGDELLMLRPDIELMVGSPEHIQNSLMKLSEFVGVWASEAIIVTLGDSGTLAVTPEGCYFVRPPSVHVTNTTGAGDAVSGGLMLALSRGESWRDALRLGTAAAASVVMNAGTAICQRAQVQELISQVITERMQTDD